MAGIKWVYTKKNMSWGGSSRNGWKLRTALAHGIVAQNTDMLKQFFPGKKNVMLIPRGVDVHRFTPGPRNEPLREQYGVLPNERIIICVANLVPVKGVEILIEAFGKLAGNFPEWKVWIVGDDKNDYGDLLKKLVRDWKLEERIIFIGKQMNVRSFLDVAEVFVLPTLSKGEGSPVALMEAMANGKVVIGSDVPGIRDQLNEYPFYIFKAGDVDHLHKIFISILALPVEALKGLGKTLSEYTQSRFDISAEVLNHEQFYYKVLDKN
jgi:glycosyltransferase involved in cell wall biosynthesis